jgi:hypothetical protein
MELERNPTTATFRKSLNDYVTAAKKGARFTLRRYRTDLAAVGPVSEMPAEFQSRAEKVQFSSARNDFPSITKSMLRGNAIIVTKLVPGKNALPKRGRRKFAVARDQQEIAAIWPLNQFAVGGDLGLRLRKVEEKLDQLQKVFQPFGAILDHFSKRKILESEIEEKRCVAENLDVMIRRIDRSRS